MRFDELRERLASFLSRTIIGLVALVLVVFTGITLLNPVGMGEQLEAIALLVRVLLVIVLVVGVFTLFYFQIRQPGRKSETGLLVRAPGAITQVDIPSVQDRILNAVNELPAIVTTTANVQAVRGRAEIELNVVVRGDDLNVIQKQKEINRALKQVVNKQLGLQMAGRPHIHIQFYNADQHQDTSLSPGRPATEAKVETKEEKTGLRGVLGGLRRGPHEDAPTAVTEPPALAKPASEIKPPPPVVTASPAATPTPAVVMPATTEPDKEWDEFASVLESLKQDERSDEKTPSEDQDVDNHKNNDVIETGNSNPTLS